MKTFCVLTLITALGLTACQKDSDYARPLSEQANALALTKNTFDAPEARADDKQITLPEDKCMRVNTTSWLSANGKFTQIRPSDVAADQTVGKDEIRNPVSKGIYTIEGQGAGFSQAYTRCATDLVLVYNTHTGKVEGRLTMKFTDGKVVEQTIEGKAEATTEQGALFLSASVVAAYVKDGARVFNLSHGEIRLVLPMDPKGSFMASVYTKGEFCVPDSF
jgi:hypothetical protein